MLRITKLLIITKFLINFFEVFHDILYGRCTAYLHVALYIIWAHGIKLLLALGDHFEFQLFRQYCLRVEVWIFLKEKESALYEFLENVNFLQVLAYLGDIFGYLNEISLSLQGPEVTIVDATERLKAFLGKLPLWKRRVDAGITAYFSMMEELFSQNSADQTARILSAEVQNEVSKHIVTLQNSFEGYFCPENLNQETWVRSPIMIDIKLIFKFQLII